MYNDCNYKLKDLVQRVSQWEVRKLTFLKYVVCMSSLIFLLEINITLFTILTGHGSHLTL